MKYFTIVFLLFILCLPAQAARDEVSFTSNKMQYDISAGRFNAEGDVTIKGRGMEIIATEAYWQVNSRVFNLSGNVTINGIWNGDNVKLSASSATAELSANPIYTLESGISGSMGKISIDCEYLQMIGEKIAAKSVHRLHDQKAGFTFSAANINGRINNGELVQAEADGNIVIKGSPGKSSGVVELRGRKALYSIERGTIIVSGGVTAIQNKRTLTAETIVFFPATNRIEARGNPRTQITINIDDERLPSPPPQNN